MQIISVKELREHFDQVKEAVSHGQSLLLVYHSKPLAEIRPVREESLLSKEARIASNKDKIKKLAGGMKLGKGFSPKEINSLYDQSYESLLR